MLFLVEKIFVEAACKDTGFPDVPMETDCHTHNWYTRVHKRIPQKSWCPMGIWSRLQMIPLHCYKVGVGLQVVSYLLRYGMGQPQFVEFFVQFIVQMEWVASSGK